MKTLPQELRDSVASQLDRRSLIACSLVSRSLRISAHRVLFNSLEVLDNSTRHDFAAFSWFVSKHERFATGIRKLRLKGRLNSNLEFTTFYRMMAALPHLRSLRCEMLSFSRWPSNTIVLNPLDSLDLIRISEGDGTCSLSHLLRCLHGLYHGVKVLELKECDSNFLYTPLKLAPYLHLHKLAIPSFSKESSAFICRTVASCTFLDVAVSNLMSARKMVDAIAPTLEELCLRFDYSPDELSAAPRPIYCIVSITNPLLSDWFAVPLSTCKSLRKVHFNAETFTGDASWHKRAEFLKQLPNTVCELTIDLDVDSGSLEASLDRLCQHSAVFSRFVCLERLVFVATRCALQDAVNHNTEINNRLQLMFPELHTKGVLQEFVPPRHNGHVVRKSNETGIHENGQWEWGNLNMGTPILPFV